MGFKDGSLYILQDSQSGSGVFRQVGGMLLDSWERPVTGDRVLGIIRELGSPLLP